MTLKIYLIYKALLALLFFSIFFQLVALVVSWLQLRILDCFRSSCGHKTRLEKGIDYFRNLTIFSQKLSCLLLIFWPKPTKIYCKTMKWKTVESTSLVALYFY